jgi:hypothetical protein
MNLEDTGLEILAAICPMQGNIRMNPTRKTAESRHVGFRSY